jgi:Leucine-rich repeat (LRR) protein
MARGTHNTTPLTVWYLMTSEFANLAGLGVLPELNTLILKQNQVTDLGTSLHGCTALAKLSVAHNRCTRFPLTQTLQSVNFCSSSGQNLHIATNSITGHFA